MSSTYVCIRVQGREAAGREMRLRNANCLTRRLPNCRLFGYGVPNFFGGRHGVEDARNDLRRAAPAHVVRRLRLEQFGIGQNDPELIIQLVK